MAVRSDLRTDLVRLAARTRSVRKSAPDSEILEILKNPENRRNRQNLDFWPKVDFLAKSTIFRKSQDFGHPLSMRAIWRAHSRAHVHIAVRNIVRHHVHTCLTHVPHIDTTYIVSNGKLVHCINLVICCTF